MLLGFQGSVIKMLIVGFDFLMCVCLIHLWLRVSGTVLLFVRSKIQVI